MEEVSDETYIGGINLINVGTKQTLVCVKKVDFGVYLAEDAHSEEKVLLPIKQVPEGFKVGDKIEVFIYKDSKDRTISTVNEPKLMLGQAGFLEVSQKNRIGAFLDWGLEKDLFLPFKEQTKILSKGEKVLVAVYVDKSGRLCGTMKVYPYLQCNAPYEKDEYVEGFVYDTSERFGTYVAIDGKYTGRIIPSEYDENLQYGDVLKLRVASITEDGKLVLSTREKAYIQMGTDAKHILELVKGNGGFLSLNDKSEPERIKSITGLSKNAFKRAVGNLLKSGEVEFKGEGIALKEV